MYPRGLTWSILCILPWNLMLWLDYRVGSTPIVGGRVVAMTEISRYSYMVSLQDRKERANGTTVTYEHFCGGNLVSTSWILTAAHCVYQKKVPQVVAAIGYESLKTPNMIRRSVDTVVLNNFNAISLRNDIALVKLVTAVVLNESQSLALVPNPKMVPDNTDLCKIIGYGAKKYGGKVQDELNIAEVGIISQSACLNVLGRIMAPQEGEHSVCAVSDSQDSCQGDSGGPLICEFQGVDYIYGIVSHGLTCGVPGVPSMYTVTVPYKKWIDGIIGE